MTLGEEGIDNFIASLGARYEAYTRNKVWAEKASEEVIIPVSENAKFREELHHTIDDLCAFYLMQSEKGRDHIRKKVHPHRSLHQALINHIGWAGQRIYSSEDTDWLRKGLAAASIEDNYLDFRDMFVALGGLYLVGIRAGMDVSYWFPEAGRLSSPSAGPTYESSMRDFLSTFEQSAYFKQDIRSKLAQK